jgi:hypothetical protein
MSNVIQLFPQHNATLYRVVDPGLTWYEEGAVISDIQLKNDCATLSCSVEDILDEMLVVAL